MSRRADDRRLEINLWPLLLLLFGLAAGLHYGSTLVLLWLHYCQC